LNIIFFTPSFFPEIGGVEKSISMVTHELILMGHNVTIITEKKSKSAPSSEKYSHFEIYRISKSKIPKTGMLTKWIWLAFHLKIFLKSDIIHFHDFHVLIFWFLPFRFLLFFKKYYITFHGYEGYPLNKLNIYLRKLCEYLTIGNICSGSFIEKWYGTKSDYITYGAADFNPERFAAKESKNILFIGRLEKDTSIMGYIEGIRILKEKYKIDTFFQICGNGTYKERAIELLEKHNIPFELYGFKNDITSFLQSARVVLCSSYLSILEALSFGKPVITYYDNPLKKDYLKTFPDQRKLFPCASSHEEIAFYLYQIFANPYSFNEYIPELIKEHSWQNIANMYLSLYRKNSK
jgi:glycosyltransferase involved in cell wall biosynthesis